MNVGNKVRVVNPDMVKGRYTTVGIIASIDPCSSEYLKYLVKFDCILGNYGMYSEEDLEVIMKEDSINALDELDALMSTPDEDSLAQLKQFVSDFRLYEGRLALLKKKTEEQKKLFDTVSQAYIPDLLRQYGLDDIKMHGIGKILVKDEVSVSIKKGRKEEFYKFLALRGEESLIRDCITVYNPSPKLKKMIKNQVYLEEEEIETYDELSDEEKDDNAKPIDYKTEFELDRKINTNTLKAHCRREIAKPQEELPDKPVESEYFTDESYKEDLKEYNRIKAKYFPPESLNLFVYSKTTIKEK